MVSRAAAFFFFFGKKILSIFKDEKKGVPSHPVFTHPAATPETECFLVWPSTMT